MAYVCAPFRYNSEKKPRQSKGLLEIASNYSQEYRGVFIKEKN